MTGRRYLRDRVLALLASRPTMTLAELRSALPDVDPKAIGPAVSRLKEAGRAMNVAMGVYRAVAEPTPEPKRLPPARVDVCVPMSRLMAGR